MEREKRNKFIKMLIRCMFLIFIIGSAGYLYTLKKSIAAENESLQQELEKQEQEWKRKWAEDAEAAQEKEEDPCTASISTGHVNREQTGLEVFQVQGNIFFMI